MLFKKVPRGTDLTNFINAMIYFNNIVKSDAGNHWNLGKLEDIVLEDLWRICKVESLDYDSEKSLARNDALVWIAPFGLC